jgi:simple sugar transport system permease protein
MVYFVVVMAIMSIGRLVTGQGQLTGTITFHYALLLAIPVALTGLGGLWAERAGIVNIGLEGMMVLGTWFGAYGALTYGPWTGVLMGVVGGALGGLLHALATVTFGVDQIISGVAINLLGVGLTDFLTTVTKSWRSPDGTPATKESPSFTKGTPEIDLILPQMKSALNNMTRGNRFFIADTARLLLGVTTKINVLVVIAVLLFPLTYLILWKTAFGLRLRSVGEDPEAADSLGVNVMTMKYVAVIMSGALAGFAGVTLVYTFTEQYASGQTNGTGYIGLAAMIFGNWRPAGLFAGAALFGFMSAMSSLTDATVHGFLFVIGLLLIAMAVRSALRRAMLQTVLLLVAGGLTILWYYSSDVIPSEFVPYFPHITTLLVLALASQRLRMPAADGKVYRRGGG